MKPKFIRSANNSVEQIRQGATLDPRIVNVPPDVIFEHALAGDRGKTLIFRVWWYLTEDLAPWIKAYCGS